MIVVSGVVKGECRHQTGERKPEEPPAITGLVRLRTPAGAAGAEVGGDSPFQSVSPDFLHVNILGFQTLRGRFCRLMQAVTYLHRYESL